MNYYVEMINEIEEIIASGKYELALIKIEQELKAPYVPKDVLNKLENLLKTVKSFGSAKKLQITQYNIDEFLFSNEIKKQLLAINFLKNSDVCQYMDLISEYFKDSKYNDELKQMLLVVLINKKNKTKLLINFSFKSYWVKPSEIIDFFENESISKIVENLELKYQFNPSFLNIGLELLNLIYIKKMPNQIDEKLINEIVEYIDDYLKINFENYQEINEPLFKKYNKLIFF